MVNIGSASTHWPAFGISLSVFTEDDDETEDGQAQSKNQETFQAWTRVHYWYDFHPGDVFYLRSDKSSFLQIVAQVDSDLLEVHRGVVGISGSRRSYFAQAQQIEFWLRTGHKPEAVMQIYQGNSRAGVLAWQLSTGSDN